ncbi:MAG: hypothetical protein WCP58_11070 [bacterium]
MTRFTRYWMQKGMQKGDRFIYYSNSDRLVVSGGITHDDLLVVMEQSGADGGRAVAVAAIDPLIRGPKDLQLLRNALQLPRGCSD